MKKTNKKLYIILFLVLIINNGCGSGRAEVEVRKVSESTNGDNLNYTIEVEEIQGDCDAKDVDVSVTIIISYSSDIDPGKTFYVNHDFGTVSKGSSIQKSFIYSLGGRVPNTYGGVSLRRVDIGSAENCKFK